MNTKILQLSNRVRAIQPSPTLAVSSKAAALRAAGKDVINLGAGEPDFDTPEAIREAGIAGIQTGFTRYTAVDGLPSLKEAIINKLNVDNKLSYTLPQVIVSCGAKQCLFNLAQAVLDPGDEVIIPAPYWASYPEMARLAGAEPKIIATDISQKFKITAKQLEQAITERTKLIILNTPSNPSGMAYSLAELQDLAAVLLKYPKIFIASDDIYEHILWKNVPFANILTACPKLYERTIVINGVSKAYAMTGWRIGYAAGPKDVIRAMAKIQSQSTSNPCSVAQKAAEAALVGDQACVKAMCAAFQKRHDYVVQFLNSLPGITCLPADGTFYLFLSAHQIIEKIESIADDTDLCTQLLEKARIALVPGCAFGSPGYLRMSFATSMENLQTALARLSDFLVEAGV